MDLDSIIKSVRQNKLDLEDNSILSINIIKESL